MVDKADLRIELDAETFGIDGAARATREHYTGMARTLLKEANGDRARARKGLVDAACADALADPDLLHWMAQAWAREIVGKSIIRWDRKQLRRAAAATVVPLKRNPAAGIGPASRSLARTWLSFPVGVGVHKIKPLGDCDRAEMLAAASAAQALASENAANMRFYRAIAQCVPEGKRVREVLTHEKIEAMWRRESVA